MHKYKITNQQLMAITATFTCGASTLIISSSAASLAKQDAWISVIISLLFGLIVIWINSILGALYPDMTYVESIQSLLGKWVGGLIAAFLIYVLIVGAAQFVWYVGDFFTQTYMTETPSYLINIVFVLVIVIALLYGVEATARAFGLLYYFFIVVFFISMILVLPNIKINNLLPILEKGMIPVLKGTIPVTAFTVLPLIILNMIYPVNVIEIKSAKKSMSKGFLIGMLVTFVSTVMCILVLGSDITADSRYPVYLLSKEINIGKILTRMESLIIIVWIFTILNNTIYYFYAGVIGLSQLLKLKDYKKIVLPLGLVLAVISGFVYTDVSYEINWDKLVWFQCIFSFGFALPIVMLIVYFVRKRLLKRK